MDSRDRRWVILAAVLSLGALCLAVTCTVVVPQLLKGWMQTAMTELQQPISISPMSNPNEPVETIPVADSSVATSVWSRLRKWMENSASDLEIVQTGTLVLPTGRVFVTDINFIEENLPLRRTVNPGRYPLYEFSGPKTSAAAIVFLSDGAPTQWVIADAFGDGGRPVSGLVPKGAVTLDSSAIIVDAAAFQSQPTYNPWPMIRGTTNSVVQDPATGANVVMLTALSNVMVIAQWGLDVQGRPVVLVLYNPDLHTVTTASKKSKE